MSIFDKREEYKPFEYPQFDELKNKLRHTYWTDTELTFEGDKIDYHNLEDFEKEIVKRTLTLIATIEVKVKDFWGQLGNHFPKPELSNLGATASESECFIEGTEILTPKGWVDFRDINIGEEVIQYNSDQSLTICNVENKIIRKYSGDIHRLYKDNTDVHITPNHEIIYFNKNGDFKRDKLLDVGIKNSDNKIPEAGNFKSSENIKTLNCFERLYIAIQAHGSLRKYKNKNGKILLRGSRTNSYTYAVELKKQRKIERFKKILEDCGNLITYRIYETKREGYVLFEVDLPHDNNYKFFDWVYIKDKSHEWCIDFINELSYWDGIRLNSKNCKIQYTSTCKKCIDKVQLIGTCAGYKTNCIIRKSKKDNHSDIYVLSFLENKFKTSFKSLKEEIYKYNGNVYCVTVPSNNIIVRYNNKTAIIGNCRHSDSYDRLLDILGFQEYYKKALQDDAIKGRFTYLDKYLKLSPHNSDNRKYVLKLILFSILIENVCLFSQFATLMYFYRYKGIMKDIRNIVKWTSIDESTHFNIGVEIIKVIRSEFPEMFDESLEELVHKACSKSIHHEKRLLDWVFENGELSNLTKENLLSYMKYRIDDSLISLGFKKLYNEDYPIELKFYYEEVYADSQDDFFAIRPVDYTLKDVSITGDDIF